MIILVEMFSDMCCLEDNASRNCQTNTVAQSVQLRSVSSLVARRRHAKMGALKQVIFRVLPHGVFWL